MSKFAVGAFTILLGTFSHVAFAKSELGQGRLFLGGTQTKPQEVNTELTAQNLKNIELNNQFGVEITFPTFEYLNLGLRYTHHLISQDEKPEDPNTDYTAQVKQDGMMGIARVPLFKSDYVIADVFAGAGVNSMTYSVKTASQDGKLEKSTVPTYAAGASVAFGFKKYFAYFEGGFESNAADNLKSTGTINNTITKIDLTGSYFVIGFLFDGIPIFTK